MNRAQMQEIQEHFESENEEIKQVMVTSQTSSNEISLNESDEIDYFAAIREYKLQQS